MRRELRWLYSRVRKRLFRQSLSKRLHWSSTSWLFRCTKRTTRVFNWRNTCRLARWSMRTMRVFSWRSSTKMEYSWSHKIGVKWRRHR